MNHYRDMKSIQTLLATTIALTLGACAPNEASSALPDRDPKLAHQLVDKGALLLDVRTREEFEKGHLGGAVLVPHTELEGRLDEVAKQVDGKSSHPIVVYCRSGKRAGTAKEILLKAGYTQVTNLGGMSDW